MSPNHTTANRRHLAPAAMALAITSLIAACGGGTNTTSTSEATAQTAASTSSGALVLPVDTNPIDNPSTAEGLAIDSVLVENNVDPTTGNDAADHLEIALSNTSNAELTGFEIFYTFNDPTTAVTENYYLQLPDDFTIPAGGTRVAHFDDTGLPDHFPINKFSLYATDTNALEVTVTVSAHGVQPQTLTVNKDAGGAETAD